MEKVLKASYFNIALLFAISFFLPNKNFAQNSGIKFHQHESAHKYSFVQYYDLPSQKITLSKSIDVLFEVDIIGSTGWIKYYSPGNTAFYMINSVSVDNTTIAYSINQSSSINSNAYPGIIGFFYDYKSDRMIISFDTGLNIIHSNK